MPAEEAVRDERQHCIVVVGGDAPDLSGRVSLPDPAVVVAADSGVDHALALGLRVDVAVGDFDSVSAAGLDAVTRSGARIERHPRAKDHTDLELALDEAMATGADRLVVVGGDGGRRDHLFANLLVLASPRYAGRTLTAHLGGTRVYVVHGGDPAVPIDGEPGEVVTLLPLHGAATSVRTKGLHYPLDGDTLPPGTTRGVSNVFESSRAAVEIDSGVLVVVVPGETESGGTS
jgi:thiamine pyrophosphokinase